jgi:hypothetical protein
VNCFIIKQLIVQGERVRLDFVFKFLLLFRGEEGYKLMFFFPSFI